MKNNNELIKVLSSGDEIEQDYEFFADANDEMPLDEIADYIMTNYRGYVVRFNKTEDFIAIYRDGEQIMGIGLESYVLDHKDNEPDCSNRFAVCIGDKKYGFLNRMYCDSITMGAYNDKYKRDMAMQYWNYSMGMFFMTGDSRVYQH